MTRASPPSTSDLRRLPAEAERQQFVREVGDALKDIGFFALTHHGIPRSLSTKPMRNAMRSLIWMSQPNGSTSNQISGISDATPLLGLNTPRTIQRRTSRNFGRLGEPYPEDGTTPTHPQNIWPTAHVEGFQSVTEALFSGMESLAQHLLGACSEYLGKPRAWLPEMSNEGNTIMRMIHYPPLDESMPEGAVRSAAHEDINFITLLVTGHGKLVSKSWTTTARGFKSKATRTPSSLIPETCSRT